MPRILNLLSSCLPVGLCVLLLHFLPLATGAEPTSTQTHWGRFRGANGCGVHPTCDAPLPWQAADVNWELPLPGLGNGSPVLNGDLAFVLSAEADTAELHLIAIDVHDGQTLWTRSFESQRYPIHARSSFASSTPCVNESSVFVCWGNPESTWVVALTHDGQELWKYDLGSYTSQHGFGSSPVLFGKTLVLFDSQDAEELPPGVPPGQSRVIALHCDTGDLLWETNRTTTRVCYSSPTLFDDPQAGPALLFSNTGDGLFALSLESGQPLWNNKVFTKRCISTPQVIGGLAIGSEGSGGGGNVLFGVDIADGHEVRLKIDRSAPYVPTPVAKGDLMFLWGDTGIVSCVRLPAGDVLWSKRIGGNVSSSPVIAGDRLIGISEDGTVTILAAAAEFAELGRVKLAETCRATPALGEHFILFRTASRLICVGRP